MQNNMIQTQVGNEKEPLKKKDEEDCLNIKDKE